jgi:hypothetical protein
MEEVLPHLKKIILTAEQDILPLLDLGSITEGGEKK